MTDNRPKCSRCLALLPTPANTLRKIEAVQTELRNYRLLRLVLVLLMMVGILNLIFEPWIDPGLAAMFAIFGGASAIVFVVMTFYHIKKIAPGEYLPILPGLRYQLDELRDSLARQQAAS